MAFMARSRTEWVARLLLAGGVIWLGGASVVHSFATTLRPRAPEQAYRLAPDDGRIAAVLSAHLSGPEATIEDRGRADTIARAALGHDLTAVPAVATLGINAAVRNDLAAAQRYFAYSQRLSRRDFRTRLWAIEDAVARNDIPRALESYDIALRTSRVAPDLLFPILASAISDPPIRIELVRTIAKQPAWAELFIAHAAANAEPDAAAGLFRGLGRAGREVPIWARNAVINRFIRQGDDEAAWSYFAATTTGARRDASRDPRFLADAASPSLFDWGVVEDGGVTSSIQQGDQGGILEFGAPPTIGGPVVRQQQMLPAGAYLFEGRSSDVNQPASSRPFWQLVCADGRVAGRLVLPNSAEGAGRFSGRINVPPDCPVQTLWLVLRPSNLPDGVVGRIEEARLRPLR